MEWDDDRDNDAGNLELNGFPENCGIGVLVGFNARYDYEMDRYCTGEEALSLAHVTARIAYAKNSNNGMVMATYNQEQLKQLPHLPATLEKAGMKCLTTFVNPNSDNQVWVYYKMLVRQKAKPRPAEPARRAERPRIGRGR